MILLLMAIVSTSSFAQSVTTLDIDLKPISKLAIAHINEMKPSSTEDKFDKLNLNFKLLDQKSRSDIFEISITNKLLLNSQIKTGIRNLTTNLIKQAQEKLKVNSTILTSFSKEIMNMIIDDYLEYFQEGFLNRYQSFSRNNPKEVKKYRQLKSKLKLTSAWIHSFIDLNAKEFNTLCTKVILESIDLSIDESYYIGKFSKQAPSKTDSFKFTPKPKDLKALPKETNLKDAVKAIDEDILESASEKIDSLDTNK